MATYNIIIYLDANYNALIERYKRRGSYVEPCNWIEFYKKISTKILVLANSKYREKTHYIDTTFRDPFSTFTEILKILHSEGLIS